MRNNRHLQRSGLSLLEVLIAGFILLLGIIPLYRALSGQAAAEIETTKISMAKEILSAARQEIISHTFEEIATMVPPGGGMLNGQPYPTALGKVLTAQKKFKDFDLTVVASFTDATKTILQFSSEVKWTTQGGKQRSEILNFMQISQK